MRRFSHHRQGVAAALPRRRTQTHETQTQHTAIDIPSPFPLPKAAIQTTFQQFMQRQSMSLTTRALRDDDHTRTARGSALTVGHLQEALVLVGAAVAAAHREEDADTLLRARRCLRSRLDLRRLRRRSWGKKRFLSLSSPVLGRSGRDQG